MRNSPLRRRSSALVDRKATRHLRVYPSGHYYATLIANEKGETMASAVTSVLQKEWRSLSSRKTKRSH